MKTYMDIDPRITLTMCQNSTRKLNTILVNYLVSHGLKVVGIQTSAVIVEDSSGYVVFTKPVESALKHNLIPVLYGECIYSEKNVYKIMSTEEIFRLLSRHFTPKHIVLLTDVHGVFTCDPKKCENPELIKYITSENLENVLKTLEKTSSYDATGSVYGKVLSMAMLSKELGVKINIVSGFDVESAVKAILGENGVYGTVIDMRDSKH